MMAVEDARHMYTALDADPEKLDDGERTFAARIRQHGWATTSIGADDEGPGFAYTTGFWLKFGHPELIVFSLPGQTA